MDDYIRTSERFRVIRVFFGVPESYRNSYWALMGHTGKERKGPKGWPHPSPWTSPNWTREGGAPFLLSPSPFPFPTPTRKGGVLLSVGVGLPLGAPSLAGHPLPLGSFIYGGRGAPLDTQVDHPDRSLAVCGAPLPSYIKEPRGRGRPAKEGAPRGSPTPTGSRTPFLS